MEQLSGLDATFLHLETSRAPMHIGAVYLLEAGGDAPLDYARFRRHIAERLPRLEVFRRRLVEVPFDLANPFWIDDPDFDLDAHLPRLGCPRPGGKAELLELAARLFARPLNRTRPLWEIAFVDGVDRYPGLARGSCALISRVHHAAVDGVSGAEIMGALLDTRPTGPRAQVKDAWRPEPVPGAATLLRRTAAGFLPRPVGLARLMAGATLRGARLAVARGTGLIDPPTLPMQAPRTPLNRLLSGQRVFGAVEFALAEIKALRRRHEGATVNDVLLAVCAGALRRHLAQTGALPDRPLVAMVPISVRGRDQRQAMGNQVSAMLVPLATQLADPVERLRSIHAATRSQRLYSSALPADQIMNHLPSATAAAAARLYSRTRLAERHRPFFNLVITNVPGPPTPLYFAGVPLRSVFGTAPLLNGLGMILVIFSQGGRISVALTACPRVLPAAEVFERHLRAALEELREAPGEPLAAPRARGRGRERVQALRAAVDALDRSLEAMKARGEG